MFVGKEEDGEASLLASMKTAESLNQQKQALALNKKLRKQVSLECGWGEVNALEERVMAWFEQKGVAAGFPHLLVEECHQAQSRKAHESAGRLARKPSFLAGRCNKCPSSIDV